MAIVMVSKEVVMGIKDWFKKKPESAEQVKEPEIELPELDREALFEETRISSTKKKSNKYQKKL